MIVDLFNCIWILQIKLGMTIGALSYTDHWHQEKNKFDQDSIIMYCSSIM